MSEIEDRFSIYKNAHGGRLPWCVADSVDKGEGLPIFSSKKKAQSFACRRLLADHQSVLAESYRIMRREQGDDYSYMDAMDALIHLASHSPAEFMKLLPGLREAGKNIISYEVEVMD